MSEKNLQPAFYEAFRCIGAACEDSCCQGWGVSVDKQTYLKYQNVSDEELEPKLKRLISIKNANSESAYGLIQLDGDQCPFLCEGLCSIQKRLGEEYLSRTCASYPRIENHFEERLERSLELSCPEAARLTLLAERPIVFGDWPPNDGPAGRVRRLVLSLLQNRNYPVAKRLILVGLVCDKWSELEVESAPEERKIEFLDNFALAVNSNLYDAYLRECTADPARQLTITLDLMVARVQLDYTLPHYLELYREFVDGLELKAGTTAESFGASYSTAYRNYYAPFMDRHQYMLEQYLVSYAFKTMLPFGLPPVNRALNLPKPEGIFMAQYMLMATYFAVSKAVMIGLAAKYQSNFAAEHVVRCIHSISRTLEHCGSYPTHILGILAKNGIRNSAGMAALTQN